MCKLLPGTNLASLDETDIETLFNFVSYLVDKEEKEKEKSVVINGKPYKLVKGFTERI